MCRRLRRRFLQILQVLQVVMPFCMLGQAELFEAHGVSSAAVMLFCMLGQAELFEAHGVSSACRDAALHARSG